MIPLCPPEQEGHGPAGLGTRQVPLKSCTGAGTTPQDLDQLATAWTETMDVCHMQNGWKNQSADRARDTPNCYGDEFLICVAPEGRTQIVAHLF